MLLVQLILYNVALFAFLVTSIMTIDNQLSVARETPLAELVVLCPLVGHLMLSIIMAIFRMFHAYLEWNIKYHIMVCGNIHITGHIYIYMYM